jgi:peptidoglycan lytic transglycosylase G
MTRRPESPHDLQERRDARIRQLREEREAPVRRRGALQPVVLLAWFAGVIALVGILLFVGFLAFAPSLMSWVEEHPGTIDQGIVRNFVEWYRPGALADEPAGADGGRISVTVDPGVNDTEIGQLLFAKGLIRSELAFQYAVFLAGRSGSLAAGTYDLSPSMRPSEIVAALRQEAGPEVTIRIQEGWRLEEIVGYLATTPLTMDLSDFAAKIQSPPDSLVAKYDFLADLPKGRSLEGYLYPDTYRVDANATASEVIDLLLTTFGQRLTQDMRDAISAEGLSIDEAVIIASIVEREAVLDKERPLIAGVFINRLQNPDAAAGTNGLLQADPTLQYALATAANANAPMSQWGSINWWQPLEVAGSDVTLPDNLAEYQTYQHVGLPPSPIAAPRVASLAAVAAPEGNNYFFVAACPNGQRDGSHYFAETYDQHLANIAKADKECAS